MIFTLHAYASSSFPTSLGKVKIITPLTPKGLNCDLCNPFSAILYWSTSRLVCWTYFLEGSHEFILFFLFCCITNLFSKPDKKNMASQKWLSLNCYHTHMLSLHTLHSKCNNWILFIQVRKYFWNRNCCLVRPRFEIRELSISPIHIKIESRMAYVLLPSSCTGNALK